MLFSLAWDEFLLLMSELTVADPQVPPSGVLTGLGVMGPTPSALALRCWCKMCAKLLEAPLLLPVTMPLVGEGDKSVKRSGKNWRLK